MADQVKAAIARIFWKLALTTWRWASSIETWAGNPTAFRFRKPGYHQDTAASPGTDL